jgi:hypothetical protein
MGLAVALLALLVVLPWRTWLALDLAVGGAVAGAVLTWAAREEGR